MKHGYLRSLEGKNTLLAPSARNVPISSSMSVVKPSLTEEIQNEGKPEIVWAYSRLRLNIM